MGNCGGSSCIQNDPSFLLSKCESTKELVVQVPPWNVLGP